MASWHHQQEKPWETEHIQKMCSSYRSEPFRQGAELLAMFSGMGSRECLDRSRYLCVQMEHRASGSPDQEPKAGEETDTQAGERQGVWDKTHTVFGTGRPWRCFLAYLDLQINFWSCARCHSGVVNAVASVCGKRGRQPAGHGLCPWTWVKKCLQITFNGRLQLEQDLLKLNRRKQPSFKQASCFNSHFLEEGLRKVGPCLVWWCLVGSSF